jgi:hypothetical protein
MRIITALLITMLGLSSQAQAWTVQVTGTLDIGVYGNQPNIDGLGFFGPAGRSLQGLPFVLDIRTDPMANNYDVNLTATGNQRVGDAPASIFMMVGGAENYWYIPQPYFNQSYIIDGGVGSVGIFDQIGQVVQTQGCLSGHNEPCFRVGVNPLSTRPFIHSLDFNHPVHTNDLDPLSQMYFQFGGYGLNGIATDLAGTITTLDVFKDAPIDPVPLPGALPLFATGLAGLGLLGWRRKRSTAV